MRHSPSTKPRSATLTICLKKYCLYILSTSYNIKLHHFFFMRWKAMRHNVISKSFLSFWKKLRQNYCLKERVLQEPLLFTLMSLVVSFSLILFFPSKNGILFLLLLYAAEKWDLMESSRNCRCFPMLQSSCRVRLSIVILYFFLKK